MVIRPIEEFKSDFDALIQILNSGGVIIAPFDTCYGLICDPTNAVAVTKLLNYKARREGKPISISACTEEMAQEYVELNATAKHFYKNFLPGPFTVVSQSLGKVDSRLESEKHTLAVRIPDSEWLLELIKAYGKPVTSTSANQSYQKTPYSVADVLDNVSKKSLEEIDLIVDGGLLKRNPPSTVIDTTLGDLQIVRQGSIIPEGARAKELISNSEAETIQLGVDLFNKYSKNLAFRPIVIALKGDLGAGKTHFTKGIAQAMQIKNPIKSPTFILSQEYKSPLGIKLYHLDTWRLENANELSQIGFEDYLAPINNLQNQSNGTTANYNIIVLEWADKFIEYLQTLDKNIKIIWMEISKDAANESRRIIRWSE